MWILLLAIWQYLTILFECIVFLYCLAIAELRLSEVKLGQLPRWLSTCSFTPAGLVRALGRGRTRYYNKYINVVRGNIAPVGQFIATFVVLNYMWRFRVEKEHRLRKHHW
ncbi:ATP synthase subunit f, mitochondrial-like [Lytechinus pictus]|uniref:ATP synthase subunit f, mitochondrial-like n=1 Tax=Lytechinus pictus TaxID=7653 RepID=UPI0030B9B7F6